jgi:hypothetical protein
MGEELDFEQMEIEMGEECLRARTARAHIEAEAREIEKHYAEGPSPHTVTIGSRGDRSCSRILRSTHLGEGRGNGKRTANDGGCCRWQ